MIIISHAVIIISIVTNMYIINTFLLLIIIIMVIMQAPISPCPLPPGGRPWFKTYKK